MFEELKESVVPISQRIAEATKELKELQDWPRLIIMLATLIAMMIIILYLITVHLEVTSSNFVRQFIVLAIIVLVVTGGFHFWAINNLKSEVATLSKHKKDNEPYLKFLDQHLVQLEKKSVTSLKSKQETNYGFLWSSSDTKTLAYIDSQDSIEAVTITPKEAQETKRITMFVVYKDANKVILKSESGEIGMSNEDYKLLTKS
ncbi:MAG: hypothetical protein D8H99_03195 [Streptococcus sp.]|nr:MAG: hypothetical protein D8H99_03195 [Streptococcus sp.]